MNENDRLALYTVYTAIANGFAILFLIIGEKDNPMVKDFARQLKVNDVALSEWANLDKKRETPR